MTGVADTRFRHRGEAGFTLTELIIVIALLTIVVSAGWMLLNAAQAMSDQVDAQARCAEETRLAMDRMTTELRQAAQLPGMDGSGVFSEIASGTMSFYADVDHDVAPERIAYRRSGARLTRAVTDPTLVDGVLQYGTPGAAVAVCTGLPPDWSGAIFTYWSRGNPPGSTGGTQTAQQLTSSDMARASAVSIHLRNSAKVGQRTAFTDLETWVKLRSVENSVN